MDFLEGVRDEAKELAKQELVSDQFDAIRHLTADKGKEESEPKSSSGQADGESVALPSPVSEPVPGPGGDLALPAKDPFVFGAVWHDDIVQKGYCHVILISRKDWESEKKGVNKSGFICSIRAHVGKGTTFQAYFKDVNGTQHMFNVCLRNTPDKCPEAYKYIYNDAGKVGEAQICITRSEGGEPELEYKPNKSEVKFEYARLESLPVSICEYGKVFEMQSHVKILKEDDGITVFMLKSEVGPLRNGRKFGHICSSLYHKNPTRYSAAYYSYGSGKWCQVRIYAVRGKPTGECCNVPWYKFTEVKEHTDWIEYKVTAMVTLRMKHVAPLKKLYFEQFKNVPFVQPTVVALNSERNEQAHDVYEKMHKAETPRALVGTARSGKTSFCRHLALSWARGEVDEKHFDVVMYVPLSPQLWEIPKLLRIGLPVELRDLVKSHWEYCEFVPSPYSRDDVLDSLLSKYLKVLWVFDGFEDDNAPRIGSAGLIEEARRLNMKHVLFTTRRSGAIRAGWELTGFTAVQQHMFVQVLSPQTEVNLFDEWVNRLGLESLCRSPGVLKLLLVAHNLLKQQELEKLPQEPRLISSYDVLGWVCRCLLHDADDALAQWERLVDLGYTSLRQNSQGPTTGRDEMQWLEECGFIGRLSEWSCSIFQPFLAACHLITTCHRFFSQPNTGKKECMKGCTDHMKEFRRKFPKKSNPLLWKFVSDYVRLEDVKLNPIAQAYLKIRTDEDVNPVVKVYNEAKMAEDSA